MAQHESTPVNYDEHDETRAESDRPHNATILAMVIATVGSLIVVVLAIVQFFGVSVRNEIDHKVLAVQASMLRDLHAAENAKLTRYTWVDQAKGVVRIPIDRAMELTVREWESRPGGLVEVKEPAAPPPAAPAPAAPAPAPGGAAPAPAGAAAPAPAGAAAPAPAGAAAPAPAGAAPAPAAAPAPGAAPAPAPAAGAAPAAAPTGPPAPPPSGTPIAPSAPPHEGATPK